jgi:hypothetical protein
MMANPEALGVVGPWQLNHDAAVYADENYRACAEHLTKGTPFKNTNGPPGQEYVPWKISLLLEEAERNRQKEIAKL